MTQWRSIWKRDAGGLVTSPAFDAELQMAFPLKLRPALTRLRFLQKIQYLPHIMKRTSVRMAVPSLALSDFVLEVIPLLLLGHPLKCANPSGFGHKQPVAVIAVRPGDNL